MTQIAPRNPVPVFPLPDFVLFPCTTAPLHVFELRYRTMVREALSGERVIAMALLKPGWEGEYEGSPEFHALGCLARFEEVSWLPNDCYDLIVSGVSRVRFDRIVREFPYRAARVSTLPQEPYSEDDPLVMSERHMVMTRLAELLEGRPEATAGPPLLERLHSASYETLVNLLCMQVDTSPGDRLGLLALDSVLERGQRAQELAKRVRRTRREPEPPESGERN